MDPTWEETSALQAEASRGPASVSAAPPPKWEDTDAPPEPSWDETDDLQAKYGTPAEQQKAALEGIGRGLLGPVVPAIERMAGVSPEAMRMREEANPISSGIGEFSGFAAPALLTGGASAGVRGAAESLTLPGLVGKLGSAVGGKAPFLKTSARLATELMALQGGSELTKKIMEDPNQTVGSALTNIGLSGALGAGVGIPLGAASQAWEKLSGPTTQKILNKVKADWGLGDPLDREPEIVSPALKQVLNVFGGVPKETMEEYAAQRDLVRAAPEFLDVYGHALDHLADMQENLATKKATVVSAQANFDKFLEQQKTNLRQMGYDAAAADKLARSAVKEAEDRIAIGLQNDALEAAPKAFSAVQKLRTQAIEMSQSARDLLENTPGALSLKPIFEAVRPMQDELYAKGFPAMAEDLGKTMDIFAHQYGDRISYADAKSMIQGLQQRGTWNMLANEVAQGTRPYYNRLSGMMNEALKDSVPAYRAAMKPTADAFSLLDKLDRYGSPESANKAVLGLNKAANYANEMPILKSLEEKSGVHFVDQLERYASPEIRDQMVKAHPAFKESIRTAQALQQLKDPETLAALRKAPYLSQAAKDLSKADAALQSQQERMADFKGVTSSTLESKLKTVMAGKNINATKALSKITGMESMGDLTVPEILHLIRIRESFEKGAMNGSRNVNLLSKIGGGLGGVIGSLLGGPSGGVGGATLGGGAGAVAGGYLDKQGPALVKGILDKYLDKYGDLPKAVGSTADSVRGALIHFLGAGVVPDAKAFKSVVNYLDFVKKGAKYLKSGAEGIFEGSKTIPNHIWTDKDRTKRLDEKVKGIKTNEQALLGVGGDLGRYMPNHGAAMSGTVARAVNYINQNRPMPQKNAPLDAEMEPSKESVYAFNRGMEIAEQPLTILQRIRDNTLLPEDVQHLNAMYPEYYQDMKQQVLDSMNQYIAKGKTVPYSLRQSLSLFLGETMDSSLSQPNLMAAQGVFMGQKMAAAQQPMPAKSSGNKGKLSKLPEQYRTADQTAQGRRSVPT